MTTPTTPECSTPPAGTPIELDVPCADCAYNLRTLPRDGVCPECGRSVEESWRLHVLHGTELGPLRANGLPWLRAMHRGVSVAVVAWLIALLGLLYGFGNRVDPPDLDWFFGAVWLFPFVGSFVVSHLAVWFLMTPRHRTRTLFAGRAMLVASVLVPGMLFINYRWAFYYEFTVGRWNVLVSEEVTRAVRSVGMMAAFAWPLAASAAFGRFTQLTWIAKRRLAAVAFGIVGLVVAGYLALVSWVLAIERELPSTSGEFAPFLIGPTGATPIVWVAAIIVPREMLRVPNNGGTWLFPVAFFAVAVSLSTLLGLLLSWLRRILTRAILLSEESEASFPT